MSEEKLKMEEARGKSCRMEYPCLGKCMKCTVVDSLIPSFQASCRGLMRRPSREGWVEWPQMASNGQMAGDANFSAA